MGLVIAIDGPAAAGKGTLSKRVAQAYGFAHLDTGALYRAVGVSVLRAGGDPADAEAAAQAARALRPDDGILNDPALRNDDAAQAASKVAAVPAVRAALLEFQRTFAATPPGGAPGAVLDGRDVGTVVCPNADAKLFVTASVEVRAERRLKELRERGIPAIPSDVLEDMKARDARDSQRTVAPLLPAADAFVLDTSALDADQAFAAATAFIGTKTGFGPKV
ncbi:cytidylate kinase [Azospirillum baldaniorum]|uniref:Cytidylate kinase n=1 Tax=Azospirillum baldaniorum TaxID=1064539 RepID=A0A9P1NKS5_9PROT|nr:(d)CMP kinase [Azospirillum baldaniorum]AWJ90832.1 cytidylate kinase [Azospirillum baldaniorum]TWA79066.1 cytidylate kinase [Azospirillum brasilense]CCC96922.1 cytidylate kinase [Azospirillum baldaniorum]